MLTRGALAFFNHLLEGEGWARTRLKAFSGQHLRLELGPLRAQFSVAGDGLLQVCDLHGEARDDAHGEAAVTVRLPDDLPLRLLSGPAAIAQATRISGSADFAETLGFVARNLRWDAEADLARVVGDLAAHRISRQARASAQGQVDSARRLVSNFIEYATEEAGFLVRREALSTFSAELRLLGDDMARLEKRLANL